METSKETSDLFSALVNASRDLSNLYPEAKGYGYDYVPLEAVIDHLKAVLPKHGLYFVQMPTAGDGQTVGLSTRIIHESGQWIESSATVPLTDMKAVNKSQAGGAAITYLRRYSLISAFGITGDKDIDANDNGMDKVQHKPVMANKETIESLRISAETYGVQKTIDYIDGRIEAGLTEPEALKLRDSIEAKIKEAQNG